MNTQFLQSPRKLYKLYPNALRAQMIEECDAMAKHAFASGLVVPGALATAIEDSKLHHIELVKAKKPPHQGGPTEAEDQYTADYHETVNTELPDDPRFSMDRLARVHQQISRIVAPATPRTIVLLNQAKESPNWFVRKMKISLIRDLMLVTLCFLIMFVSVSLSDKVTVGSGNIFESDGVALLVNLLFLLAAAGMGACFALLFKANGYMTDYSFDPKYETSYWIELIVGLVAGLILSQLIPLGEEVTTATDGAASSTALATMGKPALALLGGFSAALVHKILRRLVDTLGALFQGDPAAETRDKIERAAVKAEEGARARQLNAAAQILEIERSLAAGEDKGTVKQKLDKLMARLTTSEKDGADLDETIIASARAPLPSSATPNAEPQTVESMA